MVMIREASAVGHDMRRTVDQFVETKSTGHQAIVRMIEDLFAYRGEAPPEISLALRLTEDLDLDSLELAELSAMLEEDFGRDPYSAGIVPDTVGELVSFFES